MEYTGAALRKLIPVFNIFLVMASLVTILNGAFKRRETKHLFLQGKYEKLVNKKDIVWIIMDEYPSSRVMEKYLGFINPLDTFLANRNFLLLPDISSRTASTVTSVNAIFNYDDSSQYLSFPETINQLKAGVWCKDLQDNGYSVKTFDFFSIGNNRSIDHLFLYPINYVDQVMNETFFYVLLFAIYNNEVDKYNNNVLTLLNNTLTQTTPGPLMLWAHLLIPHMPFSRNKEGILQKEQIISSQSPKLLKERFLDYLQYGNSKLMEILKTNGDLRNKIIIISGDHGIRFKFVKSKDFYKPYCAVYMPITCDTLAIKKLKYISQIPDFIMKQLENK